MENETDNSVVILEAIPETMGFILVKLQELPRTRAKMTISEEGIVFEDINNVKVLFPKIMFDTFVFNEPVFSAYINIVTLKVILNSDWHKMTDVNHRLKITLNENIFKLCISSYTDVRIVTDKIPLKICV